MKWLSFCDKNIAWRTYLLSILLVKALALPNPVE